MTHLPTYLRTAPTRTPHPPSPAHHACTHGPIDPRIASRRTSPTPPHPRHRRLWDWFLEDGFPFGICSIIFFAILIIWIVFGGAIFNDDGRSTQDMHQPSIAPPTKTRVVSVLTPTWLPNHRSNRNLRRLASVPACARRHRIGRGRFWIFDVSTDDGTEPADRPAGGMAMLDGHASCPVYIVVCAHAL